MLSTPTTPLTSSGIAGLSFRVNYDIEPRKPGIAFGLILRCWHCATPIGERKGDTFLVSSNKVEVGGIPLDPRVWRRCRGGKSNPGCRAVNTLPPEWLDPLPVIVQ